MKRLVFLFLLLPIFAIGQHSEPQINDLQHLHSVNPALRLDDDSLEVKYLGFYVGKDDNLFQGNAIQNLVVFDIIIPNTKVMLGLEAGFSKYSYSFNSFWGDVTKRTAQMSPFLVSTFGNIQLWDKLYAGAEVTFDAYRADVQLERISGDTAYSYSENDWHTSIGVSYLPGNFIFAAGYLIDFENGFDNNLSFSAGYRTEIKDWEGLALLTYQDYKWNANRATARMKFSYKKKFDVGFMSNLIVSRLTSSPTPTYAVSAGMRFFQSSLKVGIGYTNANFYKSFSPYLVWSF